MNILARDLNSVIGGDIPRIDGPVKVSGQAKYTSDHDFPGMVYAVPVGSTVAHGTIQSLDVAAAEQMPGVRAVLHRGNIGTLHKATMEVAYVGETRPVFADDTISYYGQYVAAVIADSFEAAQAAAEAVRVIYASNPADVRVPLSSTDEPKLESERGDAAAAFEQAPVQIDETYVTPVETHNPIELHATVAVWDGDSCTLYETSQAISNHRAVMAHMLGSPVEKTRVIARFLGSGFGCKIWTWPHSQVAAVAARQLGRPVKLVLSRKMMFQTVGHRPVTQQRIRLGAAKDGRLTSLRQDYLNHTSMLDNFTENCGEATPFMYSTPNLRITSGLVRRNVGLPTAMRGPGAVPGLYALESAMDELAIKLDIDPVELRLRNEPKLDESSNLPFSSRHLVECLKSGADKFGWANRNPGIGSMRRDGMILGWGVACCSWLALRFPSEVTLELKADGSARVACGTHDIGTGTYTVIAQLVAEQTAIALDRIEVVLGDTDLPPGPLSGGSATAVSMIPSVFQAVRSAVVEIIKSATATPNSPFRRLKPEDLAFERGFVHRKDEPPENGMRFERLIEMSGAVSVSGKGANAEGGFTDPLRQSYSMHSFGAHFVEVGWQPEIARLRVNRVVSMIDAGRILNKRTGRNQIEGAIVMGVGMALLEHTIYDPRNGAPVNSNLADYVMPVHADTPEIDVTFVEYPDIAFNELGARGIGEIGLAGVAAAITNAVRHATGVRVRDLPVTIEKLLGA